MNDYFEKILQAEVYEVAKKTPLEKAHNLSNTLNNAVSYTHLTLPTS